MSRTRTITAEDLAKVMERVATAPPLKRMGCSAEAYARLGLRVIPLHHPTAGGCSCGNGACRDVGKHPRTPRGVKDATSDIETIRAWWFSHPYSNIGLATGHLVDVIDIDSIEASQSVADLRSAKRVPAVIASATTGRPGGGIHLYIATTGAGCSSPPVEGLDFRGRGGYVVAAPSIHVSGAEYMWATGPMLLGCSESGFTFGPMPWEQGIRQVTQDAKRKHAYARKMLSRQERLIAHALPGRRVPRLLAAANNLGSVVGAGWIGERQVTDTFLRAYRLANGTDERAALHAISSGLHHGRGLNLPDLGPGMPEADPHGVIDGIVAWMKSPQSRMPGLTRGRVATFDVLQGILERADGMGRTCVVVSIRDAQRWGGYASTSPAWKALKRLVAAGILTEVENRPNRTGAARRFRLLLPPGAEALCHEREQDTVGVSEDSITSCSPKLQSQQVASHSLWGHRRGQGFGLTRLSRASENCPGAVMKPAR